MNVTIADDSPLGRYLAELDAEDGGSATSLAAELSAAPAVAPPPKSIPPPHSRRQCASLTDQLSMRLRALYEGVQLTALHQLMHRLTTTSYLGPELLEDVLDVAGLSEDRLHVRWSWLLYFVDSMHLTAMPAAVIAGGAGVAIATMWSAYVASPRIAKLLLAACTAVPVGLLLVELACRLLLLRFGVASRRLEQAIQSQARTRSALESAFRHAIDLVKRAELAARGYRLGQVLPPLGRLEESSYARNPAKHYLQCRRLRWKLRNVNDVLEELSSQVAKRRVDADTLTATKNRAGDVADDATTPSLLVTALLKRHNLTSILLDSALRESLASDLASLLHNCVAPCERKERESMIRTLSRQERTYRLLTQEMSAQAKELTTLTTRLSTRTEEVAARTDNECEGTSVAAPNEVVSVNRALTELQTSCETLKALTIGAKDGTPRTLGTTGDREKREEWVGRLRRSREQMSKLIQQLSSDWESLERAIEEVEASGRDSGDREAAARYDIDETISETESATKDQIREAKRDAERDFLLVFTATSTGEKDFDLQALLRQQQLDKEAAAAPVPSFMNELTNVLEQRQALESTPVLVKRIGDDTEESTKDTNAPKELDTGARSSATPSQIDLQQLLQSRFRAQLCEESFGGSDSED